VPGWANNDTSTVHFLPPDGNQRGLVKKHLGTDGLPRLAEDRPSTRTGIVDEDSFYDWYHPRDGVSKQVMSQIPFTRQPANSIADFAGWGFSSHEMFPLDGLGFEASGEENDVDAHLSHNYCKTPPL
jgi:hypothetical protein